MPCHVIKGFAMNFRICQALEIWPFGVDLSNDQVQCTVRCGSYMKVHKNYPLIHWNNSSDPSFTKDFRSKRLCIIGTRNKTCCFPASWRLNVSISQGIWIFSSLRARWWQSSTLCRSTGAGCSAAVWNDESGEVGWWAQSSDSADCPQTILFSQNLIVFWILKTENLKR